jgi:plasmid stability protein
MSSLIVRNIDQEVVDALKARGVSNHRSMEAEARVILAAAVLGSPDTRGIGTRIRERFAGLDWDGVERPADAPRAAEFGA